MAPRGIGPFRLGAAAGVGSPDDAEVTDERACQHHDVHPDLLEGAHGLPDAGAGGEQHQRGEDHGEQRAADAADEPEELSEGRDPHGDDRGEDHKHRPHRVHSARGELLPAGLFDEPLEDLEGAADDHREGAEEVEAEEELDGDDDALPLEHGDDDALDAGPKVNGADDPEEGADDDAEREPRGGRRQEALPPGHGGLDRREGKVHEEEEGHRAKRLPKASEVDGRDSGGLRRQLEGVRRDRDHAGEDADVAEHADDADAGHVADPRQDHEERRHAPHERVLGDGLADNRGDEDGGERRGDEDHVRRADAEAADEDGRLRDAAAERPNGGGGEVGVRPGGGRRGALWRSGDGEVARPLHEGDAVDAERRSRRHVCGGEHRPRLRKGPRQRETPRAEDGLHHVGNRCRLADAAHAARLLGRRLEGSVSGWCCSCRLSNQTVSPLEAFQV
mmetsp:Transcript_29276/g.69834  ORF Transcript_29276/g.69834 Transcript_29276/m.69834 type:complete len:448 (+) Transcript_29276:101-1444(+)